MYSIVVINVSLNSYNLFLLSTHPLIIQYLFYLLPHCLNIYPLVIYSIIETFNLHSTHIKSLRLKKQRPSLC